MNSAARFHSVEAPSADVQPIAVFRGPNQPDTDIADKVAALEALLTGAAQEFDHIALASSLAAEDNVLFDVVARLNLNIRVFSLNTGRLHQDTLNVADQLLARYGRTVTWYEPVAQAVAQYVSTRGADAFYNSIELRKECCGIRKVEPLKRALQGAQAWITGQRQAQAATRAALPVREFDHDRGIEKFNPLADWSEADVWTYVRQFNVPVNALHFQGFPSIGCEPCTRAITLGEDIRAGRWWWEDPASKECGLHNANLKR
ncbi:MAG: phosphoadenylyl-sulfate reductase [Limnobacter sp.]|uniref:phosphoadenylyl-sulfate reductase n=1 Tax=Limnobacter sp. TaxID=2003368 RepID=UPI00391974A7